MDELLLKRPRGKQTVEIGSQQLGDEVTELVSFLLVAYHAWDAYMSSSGEMKISLRLMIWVLSEFCSED